MPESRKGEAVELEVLLTGILHALQDAKRSGDALSAKLLEVYRREKDLGTLSVPAFNIAAVDLELRFAVAEVGPQEGRAGGLKVLVSADALGKVDPAWIQVMRLHLSEARVQTFEESGTTER